MESLGGELLQSADGNGGTKGQYFGIGSLNVLWKTGDGLEGLEVGHGLELDGLPLVFREPAGVEFGVVFLSDGPNGDVEAEGDNLGWSGGRGGRGGEGRGS